MSALIMGTFIIKIKLIDPSVSVFGLNRVHCTDSGIATENNQVECGCRLQRVMVFNFILLE